MKNPLTSVLAVVLGAIFIVSMVLYDGWVLATTWNWFAPAVFELPELSLPAAIGVAAVVGLMTRSPADPSWIKGLAVLKVAFLYPTVTLSVAWCAKQFL